MYPVSERWKEECTKQIRQAQGLVKIEMPIYSKQAQENASFVFSKTVWDFEGSEWKRSGQQSQTVSKMVSDRLGVFGECPKFEIVFAKPVDCAGLTFCFVEDENQRPQQFRVTATTKQRKQRVWQLSGENAQFVVEMLTKDVERIEVVFEKTRVPFQKVGLNEIRFETKYQFSNKEICKTEEIRKISPACLELPRSEFCFSVYDDKALFFSEKENSLEDFLKQGQQVIVWYGMEFLDKQEWIPAGKWFLESWNVSQQTIEFRAMDRVSILNQTVFEKGVYQWEWNNLWEAAKSVLEDAGLQDSDFVLDSSLKNVFTMAPIPNVTHAAILQLIANRSKMALFVNREGKICILKPSETPVCLLEQKSIFENPKVKKNTLLNKVSGYWIWRSRYPDVREKLVEIRLKGGQDWVKAEHPIALNPSVETQQGVQIEALHYARVSYLRAKQLEKEIDVLIMGDKLAEIKHPIEMKHQEQGEVLEIQNPFFDIETCMDVFEWVKKLYAKELEYELETQGLPHLDIGDIVRLWSGKSGQTVESRLVFSGAFRQTLKIKA